MNLALSLAIVAAGACSAVADEGKHASAAAARPTTAAPAVALAEVPAPQGIAVPHLPVLSTTELEGGLIVEDMKLGDGYEITSGGAVVVHYQGTLAVDSTKVFDSSFERGEPVALPLSGVIAGWQRGMAGMKVGGIRRLTVPAAMAYGERSPSPGIPANSDLVFTIQLIDALKVEDVKVGEGELIASSQCVAITAYSITDKDGKVLERHDASDPYIWVPGEYQAMASGLEGMKRGGKRKIMVPAALNQPNTRLAPGRTANVPVTIEVELLNMRNIPAVAREPGSGC